MTFVKDGWEEEARRYAGNADYWRERAQKAEAELAAIRSTAGRPEEPNNNRCGIHFPHPAHDYCDGSAAPLIKDEVLVPRDYIDALSRYADAQADLARRNQEVIERAASVMRGEGVEDQGQAWDACLRILDAAIDAERKS